MKNRFLSFLLASISVCLLCQAPLRAQTPAWDFYYLGNSISSWTVPQSGNYTIRAYGAAGGGTWTNQNDIAYFPGGLGAIIGGTFQLSANQTLNILVGQMGGNSPWIPQFFADGSYGAGGGGGSFVVDSSGNPLVVAGGGGGNGGYPAWGENMNATTSTSGAASYHGVPGGTNGSGGTVIYYDGSGDNSSARWGGAGGGGFIGNGASQIIPPLEDFAGVYAQGGFSYLNGGAGGNAWGASWTALGGFGGGGAGGGVDLSNGDADGAGGGGGGYSGGGGDSDASGAAYGAGGGGGGSYLASDSTNQLLTVGNNNDGAVYIYLADTPSTWTGGAGNENWNLAQNWSFPPLSGYPVCFAGSNQTAVDTVTNQSVGGIVFAAGASAFTISNNTITLAGSVINQGTLIQTVNSSLALAIQTTFSADSGNLYFVGPISFGGNATFLTVNGSADTFISGNITGNGGLIKRGTGTLWLSGTNSHSGNTTIHSGNLIVQGGAALFDTGTVTLKSANATFTIGDSETIGSLQGLGTTAINDGQALTIAPTGNTTYSGSIVGAGTLILNGNGNLTLSGNSTFSGGTMLQTGTLVLAGINAAGSGRIEQSVNAGPSLLQIGTTGTITNNMTVQNLLSTQSATLAGGIFLDTAVMNVQSGATLTLSGSLVGSDTNALTKTGNGTLALNGNIPFSGEINVNSGTLIGSSTNLSGLRQNNGTVEFLQNTNGSMSNSISGTGSVTKSGTGNLTLSGSNSFTGNTTINTGTLLVNGSLGASSSVSVAAGATLGGSGTIGGSVTVQGTVSPGASTGSLSVGRIVFDAASAFDYEADSSAASAVAGDLLVVTGNIDIVAGAAIEFSDLSQSPAAFAPGTILSLVNYGGEWNGGFFSLNGNSLGQGNHFTAGGTVWSIDYTATSGGLNFASDHITGKFINVTAIPEPSTYALLAVGAIVWAGFAVRRRNRGLPTQ